MVGREIGFSGRKAMLLKLKDNKDIPAFTGSMKWQPMLQGVIFTSFLTSTVHISPDSHFLHPASVQAEFRASQKSTLFRVIPKLLTGRDYYRKELREAVDKEQWDVIAKLFELYPSKINKNDPKQIDAYDSYVNKYLFRPLKLLAGSFAEKGSSPKQQALQVKVDEFITAMEELEGCVKERKRGFFSASIKVPSGKERTEQAKKAYEAGNKALDEFVQLVNNGLM